MKRKLIFNIYENLPEGGRKEINKDLLSMVVNQLPIKGVIRWDLNDGTHLVASRHEYVKNETYDVYWSIIWDTMNIRIARKILQHPARSKRMQKKLEKLYPPYQVNGRTVYRTWSDYYLFQKAWVRVHRKIRIYGDKFRLL